MINAVFSVKTRVVGVRPILQNDLAIMEQAEGEVTKKGKVYEPQAEATGRLIVNDEGTVCQKASHFEGALIKAATAFKLQGNKTYKDLFRASVFVDPLLIPHENQEWTIDKQYVIIGRARILRCRPRIDNWSVTFDIHVTDDRLAPAVLKSIFEESGRAIGVGDYRPRYGLYTIDTWEVDLKDKPVTEVPAELVKDAAIIDSVVNTIEESGNLEA
jgi:hypothetical protein